jgi:hypothetical protein
MVLTQYASMCVKVPTNNQEILITILTSEDYPRTHMLKTLLSKIPAWRPQKQQQKLMDRPEILWSQGLWK